MLTWTEPLEIAHPAEAFLLPVLGAVQTEAWFDSGCGAGPRARWLPDGSIEIEGEGVPQKSLPSDVMQWRDEIAVASSKYGVPAQWIAGTIAAESGGQQGAHSYCCYGLMGLLPDTASSMAGRPVSAGELVGDPALNIDLGTKLIGQLFKKYDGNPIKIPAAYNAGSPKCGAGKCGQPNRWNLVADCVKGAAVDYSTRVISFSNTALSKGFSSSMPNAGPSAFRWFVGSTVFLGVAYALSRWAR